MPSRRRSGSRISGKIEGTRELALIRKSLIQISGKRLVGRDGRDDPHATRIHSRAVFAPWPRLPRPAALNLIYEDFSKWRCYTPHITDSGPCARRRWLRDRSRSRLRREARVMPSSSEEFREFARECVRWADETKSERHRQHLLESAQTWFQAALELEHRLPRITAEGGVGSASGFRPGAR
jgi:hypothetical protein